MDYLEHLCESMINTAKDMVTLADRSQLFKEVRSFRHQLILGLAISDFFMAVNFLSSCAANLSGYDIGEHQAFCSFNGFMTQFFVVQSE